MKRIALFFILIITLIIPAFSQVYKGKGKMKGLVTGEDSKPIPNVKVKLFNLKAQSGYETKTDKEGVWKAFFIRGGQWHLDFLKEGYAPKRITSMNILEGSGKLYIIESIILTKIQGPVVSKDLLKEYEQGNDLYNEKKYKEALIVFNKVIAESPETYIIYLSIGNCYMKMDNYEKAIEAYKKVIEKDSKHLDTIIAIGNCYGNKNDSKSAMEWYKKIDESKIKDPIVLYNIGVFNFNANNSKDAVKFFELAIKADEQYLDAYYQLGLSYLGLAKMKEAILTFKKYLEFDSESKRSKEIKELIKQLGG